MSLSLFSLSRLKAHSSLPSSPFTPCVSLPSLMYQTWRAHLCIQHSGHRLNNSQSKQISSSWYCAVRPFTSPLSCPSSTLRPSVVQCQALAQSPIRHISKRSHRSKLVKGETASTKSSLISKTTATTAAAAAEVATSRSTTNTSNSHEQPSSTVSSPVESSPLDTHSVLSSKSSTPEAASALYSAGYHPIDSHDEADRPKSSWDTLTPTQYIILLLGLFACLYMTHKTKKLFQAKVAAFEEKERLEKEKERELTIQQVTKMLEEAEKNQRLAQQAYQPQQQTDTHSSHSHNVAHTEANNMNIASDMQSVLPQQRREVFQHIEDIFQHAIAAVNPRQLMAEKVQFTQVEAQESTQEKQLSIQATPGIIHTYSSAFYDKIVLIGFGKASIPMKESIEQSVGAWIVEGAIIAKDTEQKASSTSTTVKVLPGSHPIPSQQSVDSTAHLLKLLSKYATDPHCLIVCLISGGGSSLFTYPASPEIGVQELQALNSALLKSGANIQDMNFIRKHIDKVKGGGILQFIAEQNALHAQQRSSSSSRKVEASSLPLSTPGSPSSNSHSSLPTVVSLVLSDIVGDPLDDIASGPTREFKKNYVRAIELLYKYGIRPLKQDEERNKNEFHNPNLVVSNRQYISPKIFDVLLNGVKNERIESSCQANNSCSFDSSSELPSNTSSPSLPSHYEYLVGRNFDALVGAARRAKQLGYEPQIMTDQLVGDAQVQARNICNIAKMVSEKRRSQDKPVALIFGGETTVTLDSNTKGRGGRNQEMALVAAKHLSSHPNIVFLSGGTDGIDGPTTAAGGIVDGATLTQAESVGLNVDSFLTNHDSFHFFQNLDKLTESSPADNHVKHHIVTGPTGTNVADVQVVLIR